MFKAMKAIYDIKSILNIYERHIDCKIIRKVDGMHHVPTMSVFIAWCPCFHNNVDHAFVVATMTLLSINTCILEIGF